MKVFKFGGASVKNTDAVKNVGAILSLYPGEKIVIVVSAMGKTTNKLEEIVAAFNASSGATNLDGLMIDEASKKVAERLLERVTQIRR